MRIKIVETSRGRSASDLMNFLGDEVTRYQHMSLICDSNRAHLFFETYNHWKSLKLKSHPDVGPLLKLLAPNLEEIEMTLDCTLQKNLNIDLPKLKVFKGGIHLCGFNCSSLKSLHFTQEELLINVTPTQITRVLEANNSLEELVLCYEIIEVIFYDSDLVDLNLKLKKLQVTRKNREDRQNTSVTNFGNFLMSQSSCLEELSVDWCCQRPKKRKTRESSEYFVGHRIILQRREDDEEVEVALDLSLIHI